MSASYFDVAEGYEPRWDITVRQGADGVDGVRAILDDILAGGRSAEVKSDQRAAGTRNLVIETVRWQDGSWRPSGIHLSEASVWIFVIRPGFLLSLPTGTLRDVLTRERESGNQAIAFGRSDPQTGGYVVPIERLVSRALEAGL